MARKPASQDAALTGFATSPVPGTIRLERVFPASRASIWDHLTRSGPRRTWWAAGDMDLRRNGRVELTWLFDELSPGEAIPLRYDTGREGHRHIGRITRLEVSRRLAFTWGEDAEVSFEIEPRGAGSALVITHRRLEGRNEMVRVASGWFTHLLLLEDVLLGREPRPFWHHFALAETEHEKRLGEPSLTIQVTRRFKAPPERVFDAWLDPKSAPLWMFAEHTGKLVRAEIDPRAGGRLIFTDRQANEDIEHAGTFVELSRPSRIVFTFGVPDFAPDLDRVTIDIAAKPNGACQLDLLHEMKPVWAEYYDRAEAGWLRILARIASEVEA